MNHTRTSLVVSLSATMACLAVLVMRAQPPAQPTTPPEPPPDVKVAVDRLKAAYPQAKVTVDPERQVVNSITGLGSAPSAQPAQPAAADPVKAARDFLIPQANGLFAMPTAASDLQVVDAVRVVDPSRDPRAPVRTLVKFQQYFQEIPVYGGEATVTVNGAAGVQSVASTIARVGAVATEAKIDAAAARATAAEASRRDAARAGLAASAQPATPEAESSRLVLFDPATFDVEPAGLRLVWLIERGDVRYFVDAGDGRLLFRFRNVHRILNRQIFDCRLGGLPGIKVISDSPAESNTPLAEAVAAHTAFGVAHRYFLTAFGRDGFDDPGQPPHGVAATRAHVRFQSMQNAEWRPNSRSFVFGPGWTAATDIVAHEYSHAVISHTTPLEYAAQPGAINEFIADVFGQLAQSAPDGWAVGEDLPSAIAIGRPLRNMRTPNNGSFNPQQAFTPGVNDGQPDHMSHFVKTSDRICATTVEEDNGCVHFNGGILSKSAVLTIDGGTHGGVQVTGIGRLRYQQILFDTLTRRLTPFSKFPDFATGMVAACREFAVTQAQGIQNEHCNQVINGLRAVGLPPVIGT